MFFDAKDLEIKRNKLGKRVLDQKEMAATIEERMVKKEARRFKKGVRRSECHEAQMRLCSSCWLYRKCTHCNECSACS